MARFSWFPVAVLVGVIFCISTAVPGEAQPLCTVTYASTAPPPLEFGIADKQGFFKQFNVVLCNRAVSGISDVLAVLKNKTADFAYEHTDNAIDWFFNLNATTQIFAGGMLGGEVGLAVSRKNNVTGYIDLEGRSFLVDSPTSGLVTDLWKITELQGVRRSGYGVAPSASAQARYDALLSGVTTNRQLAFGAMLEAPFWNMAKLMHNDTMILLGRIGEVVSPIQSSVYIYDRNRTLELSPRLVNLTAALIKANLYIYGNKAPVVTFIQQSNNLPPAVAADYYQSYVDGIQGSSYALAANLPGLANAVSVRQTYDPIPGRTLRNEDGNLYVQPSTGTLFYDAIYKAAYALAIK